MSQNTTADEKTKKQTSTPSRKISSSRLMSAFTQFYEKNDDDESSNSSSSWNSKAVSIWHNVKYGWSGKIRSNFSKEQPVWLLGKMYVWKKFSPPSSMTSSMESPHSHSLLENKDTTTTSLFNTVEQNISIVNDDNLAVQELGLDAAVEGGQILENPWEEGIEGFKRDFASRIWMTYRREFPTMNGSNYTSDCGWGCMLRSGQMLLACGLVCHFLGRSWRWDAETQLHNTFEDHMHRKIIRWFGDNSSKNSPFSIHALVNLGQTMGKKPGDWYGPASVSYLLRQVVRQAAQENADLDDLNVYVASDCTIYIQDILDECIITEKSKTAKVPWQNNATCSSSKQCNRNINISSSDENHEKTEKKNEENSCWKSLIILVPLKLGAEKLNPVYANCLKILLSTEYCIGIIGGRPKHSLYFVGFQEDKLIHLDPHYCQEMIDVNQDNFPVNSFHCKSPRKLKLSKIDPSCCIGFYCQTKADFDNFVSSVQMYLQPIRSLATSSFHHQDNNRKTVGENTSQNQQQQFQDSINYPLFVFSRGRQKDEIPKSCYDKPVAVQQLQLAEIRDQIINNHGDGDDDDDDEDETEEFVIL